MTLTSDGLVDPLGFRCPPANDPPHNNAAPPRPPGGVAAPVALGAFIVWMEFRVVVRNCEMSVWAAFPCEVLGLEGDGVGIRLKVFES
ncbi:hypothetical protein FF1_006640 [Malus domestica]